MYIAVAVPAIFFKPLILGIYNVLFVIFEYGRVISEMRGTGGQTRSQTRGACTNERAFDPLQRHALRPSSKAISLSIIIGAVIVALALGKSISGPLERLIESIGT